MKPRFRINAETYCRIRTMQIPLVLIEALLVNGCSGAGALLAPSRLRSLPAKLQPLAMQWLGLFLVQDASGTLVSIGLIKRARAYQSGQEECPQVGAQTNAQPRLVESRLG